MRTSLLLLWLCLLCSLSLQARPLILVTTSLLASAVHELQGEGVEVATLMPDGTCPGQFDLSPDQVSMVPQAVIIFRHERQTFLDPIFLAAGASPDKIAGPSGIFTLPLSYADYVDKVAGHLKRVLPGEGNLIDHKAMLLRVRMEALDQSLKLKAAPLAGKPVLCARFQREFVEWAGLKCPVVVNPNEDPDPSTIRKHLARARASGVIMVVANEQSGLRQPKMMAKELGVPCVVLGNFPDNGSIGAQDRLMSENLDVLLEAFKETSTQ